MAKDKDYEEDIDLDDDDEFGDDDFDMDFDFGDGGSEPPKNTREAVGRTLKDAGKEIFRTDLDATKDTAKLFVKESFPDSIKAETDAIIEQTDKIKEQFETSVAEIKKVSKSTLDTVSKILPENSALNSLFKKFSSKLSEEDGPVKGPSKEQLEKEEIERTITEAFNNQFEKEQVQNLINQDLESKRHASTTELLNHSVAIQKQQLAFNTDVSNRYFRKSLEIQLKQLFISKEQLEVTKTGIELFKNQLESVVKNTSLPDLVKLQTSEMVTNTIMQKYREGFANKVHQAFNPFEKMGDNIIQRMKGFTSDFTNTLTMGNDILEQFTDDSMGMSAGSMLGGMIRDNAVAELARKYSDKIYGTEAGKKFVFNVKDLVNNPYYALQRMKDESKEYGKKFEGSETLKGKAQHMFYSAGSKLTGIAADTLQNFAPSSTPRKELSIERANLTDATYFNNYTNISITKVIPTLLSKIHTETKYLRTMYSDINYKGKKGSTRLASIDKSLSDEVDLHYDVDTDSVISKKTIFKRFDKKFKTKVTKNTVPLVKRLLQLYADAGVEFSPEEEASMIREISKDIITRGIVDINYINSKRFLDRFPESQQGRIRAANKMLLEKIKRDPDAQDSLNDIFRLLRSELDNMDNELVDLYTTGLTGDLHKQRKIKFDMKDGVIKGIKRNNRHLDKIVTDTVTSNKYNINYHGNKDLSENLKKHVSRSDINVDGVIGQLERFENMNILTDEERKNIQTMKEALRKVKNGNASKKDRQAALRAVEFVVKKATDNPSLDIKMSDLYISKDENTNRALSEIKLDAKDDTLQKSMLKRSIISDSFKRQSNYNNSEIQKQGRKDALANYNKVLNNEKTKSLASSIRNKTGDNELFDILYDTTDTTGRAGNINKEKISKAISELNKHRDNEQATELIAALELVMEKEESNVFTDTLDALFGNSPAGKMLKIIEEWKSYYKRLEQLNKGKEKLDKTANKLNNTKIIVKAASSGVGMVRTLLKGSNAEGREIEFAIKLREAFVALQDSMENSNYKTEKLKTIITTLNEIDKLIEKESLDLNVLFEKLDKIGSEIKDIQRVFYSNIRGEKLKDSVKSGTTRVFKNITNKTLNPLRTVMSEFENTDMAKDFKTGMNKVTNVARDTFNKIDNLKLDDIKIEARKAGEKLSAEAKKRLPIIGTGMEAAELTLDKFKETKYWKTISEKANDAKEKYNIASQFTTECIAGFVNTGELFWDNPVEYMKNPEIVYYILKEDITNATEAIKRHNNSSK